MVGSTGYEEPITAAGVVPGDRVCLFMDRVPALYFVFLGILKMGAAEVKGVLVLIEVAVGAGRELPAAVRPGLRGRRHDAWTLSTPFPRPGVG